MMNENIYRLLATEKTINLTKQHEKNRNHVCLEKKLHVKIE